MVHHGPPHLLLLFFFLLFFLLSAHAYISDIEKMGVRSRLILE
jgi:hypothetical protein